LLTRLGDGDLPVFDLPALRCMDTEEIRIALDFCRRIGDQRRRSDLVRKELLFVIADLVAEDRTEARDEDKLFFRVHAPPSVR